MLLILIMPVFIPAAQAVLIEGAVAYGAVELIAAILIGCGIVATTSDDARAMAREVFGWLQSNAAAVLDKINSLVGQALASAIVSGVRVSGEVVDAIKQAVDSLTSTDSAGNKFIGSTSDIVLPDGFPSMDDIFSKIIPLFNERRVEAGYKPLDFSSVPVTAVFINDNGDSYYVFLSSTPVSEIYAEYNSQSLDYLVYHAYCLWLYGASSPFDNCIECNGLYWGVSNWETDPDDLYTRFGSWSNIKRLFYSSVDIYDRSGTLVYPAGSTGAVSIPYEGDIVYPSDDYLVRVPDLPDVQTDDEGKEVVVYPDLSLNPTDHLADIPKQETGEQVDVPYDTLVDVSTGEAVGEGEGPGEGDITDPADPAGTLPKPGDLSLPQLIISKFPFCIPFDVANLIGQLNASAEAPLIRIPVKTIDGIATQYITIDFSQYESLVSIVRWGIYILFVAGLAYATRNYIKW